MAVKLVPELVETFHCTVGVGSPEALALNEALAPDATVTLDGFDVTTGALLTVKVAAVVRAEPAELVKTALYSSPFSLALVVNV